jgi:hypothetical protein
MAINLGQRSSSLGSGRVEYHADRPLIHFGSPSEHDAKKRALEDFYGGDVPDSTVKRTVVRDLDENVSPFVD